MNSRWTQAMASVAILACAYWGYARTVVPWMEAPQRQSIDRPGIAESNVVTPAARYGELLASLFPENSWERSSDAKILRNNEMLLVLRDYETTDDGRLLLKPCSVVYLPKTPDSRSWKLRTDGGAELTFDKPFSLKSGGFGRLENGFLRGQVSIVGSIASGDDAERVEIETSAVQLSAKGITAPYEVHFRYGPSFGSGRDLTIDLQTFEDADDKTVEVRRIELVTLNQLTFFPPTDKTNLATKPVLPIRVQCQGPMVLDLQAGRASIEKNVLLERARENQSPDQLQCDRMTAHLLRVPRMSLSPGGSSSSPMSAAVPQLELERIVAEGLRRPAVVTSTTGNGADSRWHRFESERLEYVFNRNPKGRLVGAVPVSSRPLSPDAATVNRSTTGFRAGGSGRYITGVPSESVTQMEFRWRDRMELDTSTPGVVQLLLVGDTACRLQEFGQVFAQKLWIGLRGQAKTSELTEIGNPTAFGQLRPDKIVAEEQVQIRTDRLDAFTNRLDVVIQRKAELQPPVASSPFAISPPILGAADGGDFREIEVAPDRKFAVQGDRLLINVKEAAGQHELDEVLLEGRVRCVEASTNEADSPIEMTGSQFRLSSFSKTSGLAVIKGEPAVVRARQMAISGNNIHVDRDQNQIWIEGRGAAAMPLPARMAARFPNRPAVADLRWEGGLRFDGQTIQCTGGVHIQGPTQRVRADQLVVKLTQPIDLTAAKLAADAVELGSVFAEGNVDVENRTMDATGLVSVERALVPRVDIDYQSQTITGTGAGWIETVRRGTKLPQIQPVVARPRNAQAAKLDGQLMYLRVAFGRGFNGSMARKTLTFNDQIRAVFGPVEKWDSRLELQAGEIRPESARLSCRELTVFQIPGRESPFELMAVGNTMIWGKSPKGQIFSAQAHRFSFDPGKDQMTMQGDTRSEARLSYQQRVGGPRSTLTARQIRYWPKENRQSLDGVGMLDFNDLGR